MTNETMFVIIGTILCFVISALVTFFWITHRNNKKRSRLVYQPGFKKLAWCPFCGGHVVVLKVVKTMKCPTCKNEVIT